MNPVVIDASAGVELAADTLRGRALRALLPANAVPWVPELFFVECGAVLRRWDLNRILTPAQIDQAIDALMSWPLRVTQVRGLFADALRDLGRRATAASVGLPGIEPVAEIALTCGDAESDYAKARETTRNDLRIRRRC